MQSTLISVIGSLLLIVIGLWRKFGRISAEKRKLAAKAREDLDEAIANDDPGKLLDGFSRL